MLYSVTEVSVRPEAVGKYEELVRRLVEYGARDPNGLHWWVYEVSSGVYGSYRIAVRAGDWSDIGAITSVESALRGVRPDEAAALESRLRACASSVRQFVVQDRPDLAVPTRHEFSAPLVELTQLRAHAHDHKTVERYLGQIADAVRKLDDPRRFVVSEIVIGAMSAYTMATPCHSMTELDGFRSPAELLVEALGAEEGGRVRESFLGALASAERHILAHRDDLSNHS